MKGFLVASLLLAVACSSTSQGAGAGPGPGGGDGGPGDPGAGACTTQSVDEKAPHSGPGLDQMQPIGTFDGCTTLVIHGKLTSGGNDGVKYTGDAALFTFDVAAPGTMNATIEWSGAAIVDVVLYNQSLQPLTQVAGTTSPSKGGGPLAAGKYALGAWSRDNATDFTITLAWKKNAAPAAGAGSCTPSLREDRSGGCVMVLNEPSNGQSITLPFGFGWSAQGCESPFTLTIFGSPPSAANSITWKKSRTGTLASTAEIVNVTAAELAPLTTDTGVYEWQVTSFYGATSPGGTFTLNGATCK